MAKLCEEDEYWWLHKYQDRRKLCQPCPDVSFCEKRKTYEPITGVPRDYATIKETFLQMYGYTCACCGEPNPAFLTMEHKNRDGALHRYLIGGSMEALREAISKYDPDRFEILCYNCNMAKSHYAECPHLKEDKSYVPYLKDMLEQRYKGVRARRRLGQIRVREKRERRERANEQIFRYIVNYHI